MLKGKFITFEGGEGSGKSTQINLLVETLTKNGVDVVQTREPGGTEGAESIRNLLVQDSNIDWVPKTELLLHMAARSEHVETLVMPELERGKWVVCDRFMDSTIAYQGYGHGLDLGMIQELYHQLFNGFIPDLTIILDIAPEQGLERALSRSNDETRYEKMDLSFHSRLREGYLTIAKQEPDRCVVIDASQTIEAIAAAVAEQVEKVS